MTEVKVVGFHPRHLEVMELRSFELGGLFLLADAYDRVEKITQEGQAGTFLFDGRVVFCAGFKQVWPGVLEVWMIPSVHIKKTPISFARVLKGYIKRIAADFKIHRMHTTSFDDPFHERWMAFMGFVKEGTMQQFTQDKRNMCLYARYF